MGAQYVRRLVLHSPAGLWLDEAPPLDFFSAAPEDVMKALYVDPQDHGPHAAARRGRQEAQAKAMLARTQSMAATGKFVWPIWDKGLKKRIHRITAPTLLVWGEKDGLNPPVYGPEFQQPDPRLEARLDPGDSARADDGAPRGLRPGRQASSSRRSD